MKIDELIPWEPFHHMEETPLYDVENKEDKVYKKHEKDVDKHGNLVYYSYKLENDELKEINYLHKKGYTQRYIAKQFGVGVGTINRVVNFNTEKINEEPNKNRIRLPIGCSEDTLVQG